VRDGEHFVYRYFDAEGALLYIGLTWHFGERNQAHGWTAHWYHLAARHEIETFPDRATAEAHEQALIRRLQPPYNVKHRCLTPAPHKQYATFEIADATPAERAAINILTPQERKAALLQAARDKAASMVESEQEGTR
jgi:hypothetical protein